jgi:hypothetical protein
MNRSSGRFFIALGLTASLALAQGPGAAQPGPRANSGLNMAKRQLVEGVVSGVHIACGVQLPSIVVNKTQIQVAPVWYLLANDFELVAGESVKVTAAPSIAANDPYLYAVDITRTPAGAAITLRNELGIPLWRGAARRGGNPQAPPRGGSCVDTASIRTATGTIDRVAVGRGIQHPFVVLNAGGTLLTIALGPERILLDSDLELSGGATLTVKYAQTACDVEYIALQLVDSAGRSLVLRHDDGTPAWND